MYEIKPRADGYEILKDGIFVLWCADMKWAEYRVEEMMEKEKTNEA